MAVDFYKALETCYVADILREPGDEFTHDFGDKVPDYVEAITPPSAPVDARSKRVEEPDHRRGR